VADLVAKVVPIPSDSATVESTSVHPSLQLVAVVVVAASLQIGSSVVNR
jgi:hypothetical protein